MKHLLLSRISLIWLLLIGATGASWEFGHGVGIHDLRYASVAVILVAFTKVRFVILDFMELRHAPLPMRVAAEVWVTVLCGTLIALYLQAA